MKKLLLIFLIASAQISFGAVTYVGNFIGDGAGITNLTSQATNIIDTTALSLNTSYTNTSGSNMLLYVTLDMAASSTTSLYVDNENDGTWDVRTAVGNSALSGHRPIAAYVPNGGSYVLQTSGTVSVLTKSSCRVYTLNGIATVPTSQFTGTTNEPSSGTISTFLLFTVNGTNYGIPACEFP